MHLGRLLRSVKDGQLGKNLTILHHGLTFLQNGLREFPHLPSEIVKLWVTAPHEVAVHVQVAGIDTYQSNTTVAQAEEHTAFCSNNETLPLPRIDV